NLWGSSETVSGPGSSLRETKTIIQALPLLIEQLQIKTVLDAPCGDFNWMKEIVNRIDSYTGVDIVEELIERNKKKYSSSKIQFYYCDMTKDSLPAADLIMNRDCLVHFSNSDISMALSNMNESGSKYILTSTFPGSITNIDIQTGGWRPLNLEKEPFNLPKPILIINEFSRRRKGGKYSDKSLGLWELDKIPY